MQTLIIQINTLLFENADSRSHLRIIRKLGLFEDNITTRVSTSHDMLLFFFKLGFTPCKAEQPLRGMELREKEAQKD